MKCILEISHSTENPDAEIRETWSLPAELRELADNDREIIVELLEMFQSDTASRFERIREALTAGDRVAVRAEIHTIKGAASQMGAHAMASVCHQIEQAIPDAPARQLSESVQELRAHFDDICRAMVLCFQRI